MNNIFKLLVLVLFISIFSSSNADTSWTSEDMDDLSKRQYKKSAYIGSSNYSSYFSSFDTNQEPKLIATNVGNTPAKIRWNLDKVYKIDPQRYYVMVRFDPRFDSPQVFIIDYDNKTNTYQSRFKKDAILSDYQKSSSQNATETIIKAYDTFFKTQNKISTKKGDVISIKIITAQEFFNKDSELNTQISIDSPFKIQTKSQISGDFLDNKILSIDGKYLTSEKENPEYINPKYLLYGIFDSQMQISSLSKCTTNEGTKCYYENGGGMLVYHGQDIKVFKDEFLEVNDQKNRVITFKAPSSGDLDFYLLGYDKNMFSGFNTRITENTIRTDAAKFIDDFNKNAKLERLLVGRYFMLVEVGTIPDASIMKVGGALDDSVVDGVSVFYSDKKEGPYNKISRVSEINQNGAIYLKATSDNPNFSAKIDATVDIYTAKIGVSRAIYNLIDKSIISLYEKTSKTVFEETIKNPNFIKIAKGALLLYIVIYGIYFSLGAVKLNITDVFIRTVKIVSVIAILDVSTSWNFYNKAIFEFFSKGITFLFNSVVNTPPGGNPMFFMDSVFSTFLSGQLWLNILVFLVRGLFDGTFLVGVAILKSMWAFMKAMFESIVDFFTCYLIIYVLISVFPIFIIFMLFNLTKSMFDNLIKLMFAYMIKPSVLILFFLIMHKLMEIQIAHLIFDINVTPLIEFSIHIDLHNIGIPLEFELPFPLLPYIPFFSILSSEDIRFSALQHSCILYCIGICVHKVNTYAEGISRRITG